MLGDVRMLLSMIGKVYKATAHSALVYGAQILIHGKGSSA